MSHFAIRAEALSKCYRIGDHVGGAGDSLREAISHSVKSGLRNARLVLRGGTPGIGSREHWAIRDISFEIEQGSVVGIVGRNGAGKSTLLKVLSRITEPTSGQAQIRGRVGSLLEVGTGFHPELTGRENIFLSGAILGMRTREIVRQFDAIVEFADLERFVDTPVKHYSSGMQVRLGFAVAAHLDTEILRRFALTLPSGVQLDNAYQIVALSPDGSHLSYLAEDRIYLRAMNQLEAAPLANTHGARSVVFSPDGQWIAFFINRTLKKIPIAGGPQVTLCEVDRPVWMSWNVDDTILFNDQEGGIFRVSASGGSPEQVVAVGDGERAQSPWLLDDGETVLFSLVVGLSQDEAQIVAESLLTGERRVLDARGSSPRYLPTGHLVFSRQGNLFAAAFDRKRLEVTGEAVPLVEGVTDSRSRGGVGSAAFDLSRTGMLVYVPSAAGLRGKPQRLVWVDREGREDPLDIEPRPYYVIDLSPDGTSLAVDVRDPDNRDVWIYDLARETFSRLTSDPGVDTYPVWTPDGSRVITGSIRQGQRNRNLLWMRADGTGKEENITTNEHFELPTDVSPDGKYVVFNRAGDIALVSLEEDREVQLILHTPANEISAVFSPDGRFIAYTSDASGDDEVYVRPFPNVDDERFPISRLGGRWPLWAPDGRELFYWASEGLMSVPVETEPLFQPGMPHLLFEDMGILRDSGRTYDIHPDGQRFLIVKQDETARSQLVIVENWFEEVRRLVPTE